MSASGIVATRGPIDEALGRRVVHLVVEPLMGLFRARPATIARALVLCGAAITALAAIGQPLLVVMPGARKVGYGATAFLPALVMLVLVFVQAKRLEDTAQGDAGGGAHDCAKRFARLRTEVAIPFLVALPVVLSVEETAYGAMYAYVKVAGLLVCAVALFAATMLMDPPECRGREVALRPNGPARPSHNA